MGAIPDFLNLSSHFLSVFPPPSVSFFLSFFHLSFSFSPPLSFFLSFTPPIFLSQYSPISSSLSTVPGSQSAILGTAGGRVESHFEQGAVEGEGLVLPPFPTLVQSVSTAHKTGRGRQRSIPISSPPPHFYPASRFNRGCMCARSFPRCWWGSRPRAATWGVGDTGGVVSENFPGRGSG